MVDVCVDFPDIIEVSETDGSATSNDRISKPTGGELSITDKISLDKHMYMSCATYFHVCNLLILMQQTVHRPFVAEIFQSSESEALRRTIGNDTKNEVKIHEIIPKGRNFKQWFVVTSYNDSMNECYRYES